MASGIDNFVLDLKYLQAFYRVLKRGGFSASSGFPEAHALEKELESFLDVKNIVSVGSGTDALIYALKLLNIGLHDEVIVPALSFITTASSVSWVGAVPVFVDVSESDLTINTLEVD